MEAIKKTAKLFLTEGPNPLPIKDVSPQKKLVLAQTFPHGLDNIQSFIVFLIPPLSGGSGQLILQNNNKILN